MMGPKQEAQAALFYEFSLEDHIPQDHLLRAIDRFTDLSSIRGHLADFYSRTGRPSIDPELMIRMLLVGYCFGIRSERRLCEEVDVNLAYRWFCKLDLSDPIPDHSTFSKNRHGRFRDSDLFRHLFETVVTRCMAEGLVGGETFATDASIIQADANKQYSAPKADWETAQIDPAVVPRAVREYLETLDDAAFGAASDVTPKFTSFSDPASQWTGALKGPAFFAYSTNYLIDTDHAIILDVEATRAIRPAEVGATRTMLTRTRDRFDLFPDRLAADTAYGSGNMLGWLVDHDIEPHVPVIDKSDRKDGTFSNLDFRYDPATDEYTCPGWLGHYQLTIAIWVGTMIISAVIYSISISRWRVGMPPPLRPLIAIHLAPLSLFGTVALIVGMPGAAQIFAGFASVVLLLMIVKARYLAESGFSPLWGAFTFPLASYAGLMLLLTPWGGFFKLVGIASLTAATFLIPYIVIRVLMLWISGALATKTNAAVA